MVRIFVPDLPEFLPIIHVARKAAVCEVVSPRGGYWQIEAEKEIRFERKPMGLGPALWNSALTGGFSGRITEYSRDILRIENES